MNHIYNILENNGIINFLKFIWPNTNITNISNVLSFVNSIFCVIFMYQYKKTKNIKAFTSLAFHIFIPFLVIDLFINIYLIKNNIGKKKCIENAFHHIITLLIITWVYFIGRHRAPDVVYNLILFETSTIFLNLRFWMKDYLKVNDINTLPTFIKICNLTIDALFIITFLYFRCYVFLKEIIFNKDFYTNLLADGLFINKLFIILIFVFLLLNFYWSYILFKTLYKNLHIFFKEKDQEQDKDIALIEKLNSDIIKGRNTNN